MPKVSVIPWIIKKLKGAIGIVEDTDTATHAIASGKYVIWKGVLCKASSAIAVNDTLSTGSGGNLTVVDNGGLNDVQANIPAVYDGLDSTSTTSALSAAQGKALNEKSISNTISGGTLTDIQSSLITFCQAMALNDTKPINFTLTTASGPFQALTYYGTATKAGLARFIFKMQTYSWNADEFIIGTVSDGTWAWNELALNSKITTAELTNLSAFQTLVSQMGLSDVKHFVGASSLMTSMAGVTNTGTGYITKISNNDIDCSWTVAGGNASGSSRYNVSAGTFTINNVSSNTVMFKTGVSDANTVIPGVYLFGSTGSNIPEAATGYLIVFGGYGNYAFQLFCTTNTKHLYFRSVDNNNWKTWAQL